MPRDWKNISENEKPFMPFSFPQSRAQTHADMVMAIFSSKRCALSLDHILVCLRLEFGIEAQRKSLNGLVNRLVAAGVIRKVRNHQWILKGL